MTHTPTPIKEIKEFYREQYNHPTLIEDLPAIYETRIKLMKYLDELINANDELLEAAKDALHQLNLLVGVFRESKIIKDKFRKLEQAIKKAEGL